MSDDPPSPPTPDPAPPPKPGPSPSDPAPADPTDWKAEARKHENRSKTNATALEKANADLKAEQAKTQAILKAAGLAPDDDPAESLKKAVQERDTAASERDQARSDAALARMELRAERIARKAGADVDVLMDSRTFEAALRTVDPGSKSLDDDLKKLVEDTLKANPHLKVTGGPPASGREPTGATAPPREVAPGLDRIRSAYEASSH